MKSTKLNIADLSCEMIEVRSIDFDFSEGFGETWEFTEASRCEKCNAIVMGGGDKHSDLDGDSDCDGYVSETSGPMMSYYYPCPELDAEEAAQKLVDTCLCVVTINNETALALTGGGMDLSWEICRAYIDLGYLPPLAFCDLPGICGKGLKARDRDTVAACLKTCAVAASWANRTAERINDVVKAARRRARADRKEATSKTAKKTTKRAK